MNVSEEFARRVAEDRLCAAVMRAVRENDAAALERLGMRGFGRYAGRLSELIEQSVRRGGFSARDFAAIMGEVAKPAHYAHHLVNEGGSAIQQALDERNGLRIKPAEPEFDDGRLCAIVNNAAESESENAAGNLAAQLGTMVKDMGNEFMRQNAEQRDRAGFKVTVERTGGANCCPWCADRIGRWELKNAPKDVFGVHDNCTCMVVYTNSRGVRSQRLGRSRFVDVPYEPPHRMTAEEAAAKGGFSQPRRLTGRPSLFTDMFEEYNNGQKDTIKLRNIEKELEKSPIGREIKQYLKDNPCKIYIFYNVNVPKELYGEQDPINDTISIYASNTKTVAKTVEVLIHELTHRRYNIGGDLWSESVCKAQEYKHKYRRNDLTIAEKRAIIKEIKQAYLQQYPEWKWRNRR